MPQLENGYTRMANELIERLAGIRIPGEAMQALWLIIRKTYGFNKKSDTIALLQFCEHTGMKKPAVCRAVKKLEQLGIVSIIKKDNGNAAEYAIIKDSAKWQPLSKKITLSKKIIIVIEKDNKPLSKKIPSKETTKDKIQEDSSTEINSAKPARNINLVDDELIAKLEKNEAYTGINIRREYGKLLAWIETPRGRGKMPTKARFINWLNRATPCDTKPAAPKQATWTPEF